MCSLYSGVFVFAKSKFYEVKRDQTVYVGRWLLHTLPVNHSVGKKA